MATVLKRMILLLAFLGLNLTGYPQHFKVLAFYTAREDAAHLSFVQEAHRYFAALSQELGFRYDSTSNWDRLSADGIRDYQVLIFLDTRPEGMAQRKAFEAYMEQGGGFLGFHFSAFALTPSKYPQNWDWYHNQLLGSGEYKGNTWRPTAAVLRVENPQHPATRNLPETFTSAPNEWYSWQNDLRKNPAIQVLLSIDSSSFPVGTGPKPHEIWHRGDYPVVWTHRHYRMLYVNMGHNDMDYEHQPAREVSFTFQNQLQNQLIRDGLMWLGKQAGN